MPWVLCGWSIQQRSVVQCCVRTRGQIRTLLAPEVLGTRILGRGYEQVDDPTLGRCDHRADDLYTWIIPIRLSSGAIADVTSHPGRTALVHHAHCRPGTGHILREVDTRDTQSERVGVGLTRSRLLSHRNYRPTQKAGEQQPAESNGEQHLDQHGAVLSASGDLAAPFDTLLIPSPCLRTADPSTILHRSG